MYPFKWPAQLQLLTGHYAEDDIEQQPTHKHKSPFMLNGRATLQASKRKETHHDGLAACMHNTIWRNTFTRAICYCMLLKSNMISWIYTPPQPPSISPHQHPINPIQMCRSPGTVAGPTRWALLRTHSNSTESYPVTNSAAASATAAQAKACCWLPPSCMMQDTTVVTFCPTAAAVMTDTTNLRPYTTCKLGNSTSAALPRLAKCKSAVQMSVLYQAKFCRKMTFVRLHTRQGH